MDTNRGLIKSSELFWKLSDTQIDRLVDLCQEQSFEAGATIFGEGESANNLYIVKEGKVVLEMQVRIGQRTKRQATVSVISKGQVFGWSVLSEKPIFTMSAVCTENTNLLVFSRNSVLHLCGDDHSFCHNVMSAAIRLAAERLNHAQRTLAQVLSVTSHDLRAPLATVQSCLDVILGGFAGDVTSRQRELLTGSKQRITDLTNMVDNILDISYIKISKQDFERVSLYEVVGNSVGDVQGIAQRKEVQLRNHVSPNLPQVMGTPKRLQQVFTNLLSNGVKFTPAGGSISISSHETEDSIRLEVADTGVGISPDELPKLFAEFYRGKHVDVEGAGLGLSIAKKIVEAHGGRIWVESPCPETGVGCKFCFTVPRAITVTKGKVEEEKKGIAGARILVTDDDPEMRNVVTLLLESQGYKVFLARDGEEALAKIQIEKPDLLLLDLLMPRMDGFEVCKRLNELAKAGGTRIPTIIMSAVREDSSRQRYELETKASLGIDDYVEKPISPPILLQRVEKVLMKSLGVSVQQQAKV